LSSIRAIVTHPTPDLDALLCVYLLRRFGEDAFPGVSSCALEFLTPTQIESTGGPGALETDGRLVVDVGGGRFDNHPTRHSDGDLDASAAELVAEHLGVRERPELGKLLEFGARQDLKGESLRSRDPVDHAIALPAVIDGLNLMHPDAADLVYSKVEPVFDAIVATERAWYEALEDADRAVRGEVGRAQVLAMESASKAAARAGRYAGADLLLVRYLPQGYCAFTVRRNGPLRTMTLEGLAERVRRAEHEARGEVPSGDLRGVGMRGGWFLHQSRRILNKGSPKAPDVEPTILGLRDLHAIAVAWLHRRRR